MCSTEQATAVGCARHHDRGAVQGILGGEAGAKSWAGDVREGFPQEVRLELNLQEVSQPVEGLKRTGVGEWKGQSRVHFSNSGWSPCSATAAEEDGQRRSPVTFWVQMVTLEIRSLSTFSLEQ